MMRSEARHIEVRQVRHMMCAQALMRYARERDSAGLSDDPNDETLELFLSPEELWSLHEAAAEAQAQGGLPATARLQDSARAQVKAEPQTQSQRQAQSWPQAQSQLQAQANPRAQAQAQAEPQAQTQDQDQLQPQALDVTSVCFGVAHWHLTDVSSQQGVAFPAPHATALQHSMQEALGPELPDVEMPPGAAHVVLPPDSLRGQQPPTLPLVAAPPDIPHADIPPSSHAAAASDLPHSDTPRSSHVAAPPDMSHDETPLASSHAGPLAASLHVGAPPDSSHVAALPDSSQAEMPLETSHAGARLDSRRVRVPPDSLHVAVPPDSSDAKTSLPAPRAGLTRNEAPAFVRSESPRRHLAHRLQLKFRWLHLPFEAATVLTVIAIALASAAYRSVTTPAAPQAPPQPHPTMQTSVAADPEPPPYSEPEGEPVRVKNPFDASEVFEFPAGTSDAAARQTVADLLLERGRTRIDRVAPTKHNSTHRMGRSVRRRYARNRQGD